jgi:hypothetical protein
MAITRLKNHTHMAFLDINNEIGRGRMFHRVSCLQTHAWLRRLSGVWSSAETYLSDLRNCRRVGPSTMDLTHDAE